MPVAGATPAALRGEASCPQTCCWVARYPALASAVPRAWPQRSPSPSLHLSLHRSLFIHPCFMLCFHHHPIASYHHPCIITSYILSVIALHPRHDSPPTMTDILFYRATRHPIHLPIARLRIHGRAMLCLPSRSFSCHDLPHGRRAVSDLAQPMAKWGVKGETPLPVSTYLFSLMTRPR